MKVLQEDQARAVEELRDAVRQGQRRIMMQGATGWGKTLVAASIIESALKKGKRTLLTVPALPLIDQTVDVLYAQGMKEVGVIQADHPMTDWSKPVQVASLQTLTRRAADGKLPAADVQIIDEAHINYAIIGKLLLNEDRRHTTVSIGLSASPWTKGLGRLWERLIVGSTVADLIKIGRLAPFRVFAPSHPDLKNVRTVAGDYHEGELAEAMNKATLVADIVETWLRLAGGRPTICFAVNRAHANAIARRFELAGVCSAYMDCDTPGKERKAIHKRLLAGEVKIVCNVDVIGTGVDWPEVSCCVYARPTRSKIRLVQNIGRVLRLSEGKADALIIDHSDTHLKLGFVTDITGDLDDGKPKLSAPASPPLPKECPKCSYLKPPRMSVCPACGHKTEQQERVTVKKGELAELKESRKPSPSAKKWPDKARTFGALMYHARRNNKKDGWAAHKFREIYGVWPRGLNWEPFFDAPWMELASWIKAQGIKWSKSNGRRSGVAQELRESYRQAAAQAQAEPKPSGFVDGTLMTQDDIDFGEGAFR